jgi:lipoteichoic acid synthase
MEFMSATDATTANGRAQARVFWAGVWLALALVALKASYLGSPAAPAVPVGGSYLRSLAAISYLDVVFALCVWTAGSLVLLVGRSHPAAVRAVSLTAVALSALFCFYALVNIILFGILGGFITYPLLLLIGNVRMLSSSVNAHLTLSNSLGMVGVPLIYVVLVYATLKLSARGRGSRWRSLLPHAVAATAAVAWVFVGQYTYANEWVSRQERRIAENPHWVLVSSWVDAARGHGIVRMTEPFLDADLTDFDPLGVRPPLARPAPRRVSAAVKAKAKPERPPNVIVIVLESVAARWTSLNGPYETTTRLKAESAHGVVFENAYAHIGRSSNSLAAMLLSVYPKLDFREATEEPTGLTSTSLAALFHSKGYRTAFYTPSDLQWAGWNTFLADRGFDELRDSSSLPCSPISSWGVEDRCMIDAMIEAIERDPAQPLFLMGWTTQTHHPYEPTPGIPALSLLREQTPDDYNLERYLNVLHETDRHLGRLFDAVRRTGLADNTVIVVTGDHGQAFGYPHDSWMQGKTLYQEDVHVPLMLWSPRKFRTGTRSKSITSHVDLAPTVAELAGLAPAPEWQGRSVFDAVRVPRAYFYVAEDQFTLGIREDNWKYIFNLREGVDELYNLDQDPTEQQNLAKAMPERALELRRRLAAWTEANRRQYDRTFQRLPAGDVIRVSDPSPAPPKRD